MRQTGVGGLLTIVLTVVGCASGPAPVPEPASLEVAAPEVPAATPARSAPRGPVAVTHLGRTVLPRCDLVLRGRITSVTGLPGGTEVAKVATQEMLLGEGVNRDVGPPEGATVTVFCGEQGLLPRAGGAAALLLRRRPGSANYETLQVTPLSGSTGEERVNALKSYIAVESLPTERERVEALLAYLREAALDPHPWTRDNAALEYGSLARSRPADIGPLDGEVLQIARTHARERAVRRAIDAALAASARSDTRADAGADETEADAAAPGAAAPPTEVWIAKLVREADPTARREHLLDGAIELGEHAAPLLRRGLRDEDARVREAAAAAAGELGIEGLDGELLALLDGEEPVPLRRSAVRALGYLRSEAAVPALQAVADARGDLGRDACFALARIRTPDAVADLGRRRNGETDPEWRELLDFLLSPAFVEQERGLGREVPE